MLDLKRIGEKITSLRKQKKMTQGQLADALFVTHQAVSKWENGKSIPSIEILYDMTRLFEVSIDFILDHSEIKEDDYERQFMQYPREAVISKFLNSDYCCDQLDKIFYLLKEDERNTIIDQIISGKINVHLETVWHLFSKKERHKILNVILSRKYKYDIEDLYKRLSPQEQLLVQSKKKKK